MIEVLLGIVAATALVLAAGMLADNLPHRILDKLMRIFK